MGDTHATTHGSGGGVETGWFQITWIQPWPPFVPKVCPSHPGPGVARLKPYQCEMK